MPDATTFSPAVVMARNRWRAAEDRLYPTLITDPGSYQRSINAIQAVATEIRRRRAGPRRRGGRARDTARLRRRSRR